MEQAIAADQPKRIHVIACGVLAIDLRAVAERIGIDVSMEFLPGGLHSTPHELRRRLQEAIDTASAERRGDRIAIGYGACGLGTVGIHARNIPLAIPRVHDCIGLFLGSDAAYREQFARCPGTYYISAGWVEEKAQPPLPTRKDAGEAEAAAVPQTADFEQLVAKYGRENAEAIRHFLNSWQRNYRRAAFIDTGAPGRRRYADMARAMAEEFGWAYEELPGTGDLLAKLLTRDTSSDEVLIVPPHHVTIYDPLNKGLKAVPVWEGDGPPAGGRQTLLFHDEARGGEVGRAVRLGLGIDAGGTYTDAVLYDFAGHRVVGKAKALTTKWDFTVGIGEALDRLDAARLAEVDLVAISTTLATNAIVEGRGQKVGLLIMPPYGLFDPEDIAHRPIAILDGRMEIDGTEIAPIDAEQVRRAAREMVDRRQVGAFAVAGYASQNNPSHELQVKEIVRRETRLSVTCGHDVSEGLNYRVRAATAALNARIIPCLQTLLGEVQVALERRGIGGPKMIVKSDGSLMSVQTARERPIETILSGPAASVAGATYLAGRRDAIVVDVGGTTTDTAIVTGGVVRTCEEGASVGGWRTHVRALDMRTLGLGGDSLIARRRGELLIGPARVAPVSWLLGRQPAAAASLDWLRRHLDRFDTSTGGMELLLRGGRRPEIDLGDVERRILAELGKRALSVHELACRLGRPVWELLPLQRLEDAQLVQRCGLTPTDLLHVTGQVSLWDAEAARGLCGMFGRLAGQTGDEFAADGLRLVVRKLAVELLKKQLDETIDGDGIDDSPAAMALIDSALGGEADGYRVRVSLSRPIIGIGAPVHCFLPEAARLLGTEAIIPPDADVANAIGAITSSVFIHKRLRIAPNDAGQYTLYGLPEAPAFADFNDAHRFAVAELTRIVRELAARAGTSQTTVEVIVEDRIAPTADGGQVFVGRTLEGRLSGHPDVARLEIV